MTSSLSDILKLLMFKEDIRTSELARKTKLPQQTLQRIVSGASPSPHQATLEPIAEFFKVSIDQLRGLTPIQHLNLSSKIPFEYPQISMVKMISWEEAAFWPGNKNELLADDRDKVFTDISIKEDGFALKAKDASMLPLFPEGTILIVDPHAKLGDRQYVVVKLQNQPEATFRQLLINLDHYYIKPLSPDFSHLPSVALTPEDKICGVVVQARHNY